MEQGARSGLAVLTCGREVVSGPSLGHKRYYRDPDPVDGAQGCVIFVSPSGTIRKAIRGDHCEHFRSHQCSLKGPMFHTQEAARVPSALCRLTHA
jgi:hypothetical protein